MNKRVKLDLVTILIVSVVPILAFFYSHNVIAMVYGWLLLPLPLTDLRKDLKKTRV